MARNPFAARRFADARIAATFPPSSEPASGVHRRIPSKPKAESFSAWVQEHLSVRPPATRSDVEDREEQLLAALHERDIPTALVHACALVYLDPENKAALRIKLRCAREMQRAERAERVEDGAPPSSEARPRPTARSEGLVPRMQVRWSDLRDRPLSQEAVTVLTCIDGKSPQGEVVALSGLPAEVANDALEGLVRDGIVSMDARRSRKQAV